MMTDEKRNLPKIHTCYGTLPSMLRKFDKYARQDCFAGHTREEFEALFDGLEVSEVSD